MMTLHKLSAGDGYKYYTREVASADELRSVDRNLGDYYTVNGNPPGQWGGSGAPLLGVSGEVTEEQMAALYGQGLHPNAEQMLAAGADLKQVRLGQRPRRTTQTDQELRHRIDRALGDFERMNHRAPSSDERRLIRTSTGGEYFREVNGRNAISNEELARFITSHLKPASQAVSGFDLVFAPAKSASILWAVGGEEARTKIEQAHHEAIEETMKYLEREAVYTRRGRNGVRQEEVDGGLIYTSFRHYDSRNGDPQLHDHVVVANRVRGVDGKWSTLDADWLYTYNVAASEHYNRAVMEKICHKLGVGLVPRKAGGNQPIMEIAGIDISAIEAASSRRGSIMPVIDSLVDEFVESHGYAPSEKQMIALAQQATLITRPTKKEARQLSALVNEWSAELSKVEGFVIGQALVNRARNHKDDARNSDGNDSLPFMVTSAEEVDHRTEAQAVIHRLEESRSAWGKHHIIAEVRRRLGSKFGEIPIPEHLVEEVTQIALNHFSLKLTADDRTPLAEELKLENGDSKYGKSHRTLYTSPGILHCEDRLISAAQQIVIPTASAEAFDRARARQNKIFDAGQVRMAREFACGEKLLTIGIGPAGAGKTTTLKLVAAAVEEAGGTVIGLAPTAAAATVMSQELGSAATTIDSFVLAHLTGGAEPHIIPKSGDLIIIDEAGMVGTPLFASAVTIAEQYGARIVAIGDDNQLSAVGSGGALRYLKNEVGAVWLEDLHRFRNIDGTANREEAAATLALREPPTHGEDNPWTFYRQNNRVAGGDRDTMVSELYTAWQRDTDDGKHSVMMAFDNATVTDLNARAQTYRRLPGR